MWHPSLYKFSHACIYGLLKTLKPYGKYRNHWGILDLMSDEENTSQQNTCSQNITLWLISVGVVLMEAGEQSWQDYLFFTASFTSHSYGTHYIVLHELLETPNPVLPESAIVCSRYWMQGWEYLCLQTNCLVLWSIIKKSREFYFARVCTSVWHLMYLWLSEHS